MRAAVMWRLIAVGVCSNAHFVLDHIGKGDFTVQQAGESMVMTRQQNKDLPGPGNDAVYTIDLKACNPARGEE